MAVSPGIADIELAVALLPDTESTLFRRMYSVAIAEAELRPSPDMEPWLRQQFGSVEAVARQKIVKVTNMVTGEEALFNSVRGLRPIESRGGGDVAPRIALNSSPDIFSDPYSSTPEDTFGRVVGKYCVTASNIAKFDALHSVVVFNAPNPLGFTREQVVDYIEVAREWARRASAARPGANYFLFFWNCQWRAGASIHHGHAQVVLTSGRHYARIERLRQAALVYQQTYGTSYFADLVAVHRSLGCALERNGVTIVACLTPLRSNDVILIADKLTLSLKETVYEVLACFRDRLGVTSFNFGLVTPPLGTTEESWQDFPVMARLVDRGDLSDHTSDIGGMELFAASVVATDPFRLARQLREFLQEGDDG